MSAKTRLQYSLHEILKKDNYGSYATRHDRKAGLLHFAEDLVRLGYKLLAIQNLKQKHIIAVVDHWKKVGLENSTLKNRLSMIRRLAVLLGKPLLVPSNDQLQIGRRRYVPVENCAIHNPDFSRVTNPYVRVSLELQRVFGLRREESLKIKPHIADKQQQLSLASSWCKGGRARTIPIETAEQRYWLEQAKILVGKFGNSLIPPGKTYIQQRWVYDKQVASSNISHPHGLRHAYAQRCYKELTGWEAPINGGPSAKQLTSEQKEIDLRARLILSELLGHGRSQITVTYVGR